MNTDKAGPKATATFDPTAPRAITVLSNSTITQSIEFNVVFDENVIIGTRDDFEVRLYERDTDNRISGIDFPITNIEGVLAGTNNEFTIRATVPDDSYFASRNNNFPEVDVALFVKSTSTIEDNNDNVIDLTDAQASRIGEFTGRISSDNREFLFDTDFRPPSVNTAVRSNFTLGGVPTPRAQRVFSNNNNDRVVSWLITFDNAITNVAPDGTDFDLVLTKTDGTGTPTSIAYSDLTAVSVRGVGREWTYTATLPDLVAQNLQEDYYVNLQILPNRDISRAGGNVVSPVPSVDLIPDNDRYIYNNDVTSPTITYSQVNPANPSITPASRFTTGGSDVANQVVYHLEFDRDVTGVLETGEQFSLNPTVPFATDPTSSLRRVDDRHYQLTFTFASSGNELGTKFNLQYTGTGIVADGAAGKGNPVPYRVPSGAATGDVESSPTFVTLVNGSRTLKSITSFADTANDVVEFTVTFNTRVGGLTVNDFIIEDNVGALGGDIAAVGGDFSLYAGNDTVPSLSSPQQSDSDVITYSTTWKITSGQVGNTESNYVELSIDPQSQLLLDTIGPDNGITPTNRSRRQTFTPTAPILTRVERIDKTGHRSGQPDRTVGGEGDRIQWRITFDQPVTDVGTTDFFVVDNTGDTISRQDIETVSPNTQVSGQFARTYVVTADLPPPRQFHNSPSPGFGNTPILPTADADGNIEANLAVDRFNSAHNIRTASGTRFNSPGTITDTNNDFIWNTDFAPPEATVVRSDNRKQQVFDNNNNDRMVSWDITYQRTIFDDVPGSRDDATDSPVRNVSPDDFEIVINPVVGSTPVTYDSALLQNVTVTGTGNTYTYTATLPDGTALPLLENHLIDLRYIGTDVRRTQGNQIKKATNRTLTDSSNRYIYSTDTTAPIVTDVTLTPADRFASDRTERITWNITFDHDMKGAASTQFEVRDESGNKVPNIRIADPILDITKRILNVTAITGFDSNTIPDPTKLRLHYIGDGDDVLTRDAANDVPYKPLINNTLQTTPQFYALAVGIPRFTSITSDSDRDTGIVTYKVNFGSRVTGVNVNNFTATELDNTPVNIILIEPENGGASVYEGVDTVPVTEIEDPITSSIADSTAFASVWTVQTAAVNTSGNAVTLTLNSNGINPEGPATTLQNFPTTLPSETAGFISTVPLVESVTRIGSHTNVTGQNDIAWEVIFDQSTIQVDATDFEVVTEDNQPLGSASIISLQARGTATGLVDPAAPESQGNSRVTEATEYIITASLPDMGSSASEIQVHLRIKADNNIMGAAGARSTGDNTSVRRPFLKADRIITAGSPTAAFTYRTLSVENVSFTLHNDTSGSGQLSGGTTAALAASRPARIVWTVTYNIDPETGSSGGDIQNYYDIECSLNCVSNAPVIAKLGNTHTITALALPEPADANSATATLVLGHLPLNTANTDLQISGDTGTVVHYHRDVVATNFTSVKTATQIFYVITFNESITGLTADELSLLDDGTEVSAANITLSGTDPSNTRVAEVTLPDPIPDGDLSLRILDSTPDDRIRVTGDNTNRIAYTNGGGYDTSSPAQLFTDITEGATAPSLTVTLADSTGAPTTISTIDGDSTDDDIPDTYYWRLEFDQDISTGITVDSSTPTNQFALQFVQGGGAPTNTVAGIDNTDVFITQPDARDDSLYLASFAPGVAGIEAATEVHLIANTAADTIMGEERIDTTNPPNRVAIPYVPPTSDGGRVSGFESFALLNRARWSSIDSSVAITDPSDTAKFGDITFTTTFSRPVVGVTSSNFAIAVEAATGSITTPTAIFRDVSPHPTNLNQWNIEVDVTGFTTSYNGSITLSASTTAGIVSTGDNNPISSQFLPVQFAHLYLATTPTVTGVTRDDREQTTGGSTNTRKWTVTFDQATTNVDLDDFAIVDASDAVVSGASLAVTTPTVLGTNEESTYEITVELPITATLDITEINLRILGNNDIMGSSGATAVGDSTPIRRPFGTTAETITTSANAYSLRVLRIESITRTLYDHLSNTATENELPGGTVASPASRPQRILWTVTYNIPPDTGITAGQTELDDYYQIACSNVDCSSITEGSVLLDGNTHTISLTNIPEPTDAQTADNPATITLMSGTVPLSTDNTNVDIDARVDDNKATTYHRYLDILPSYKSAIVGDEVFYFFQFNASGIIEGLEQDEVTLLGSGVEIAATSLDRQSDNSWRAVFDVSSNPAISLNLRISDVLDDDRIRVATATDRIAYNTTIGGRFITDTSTDTLSTYALGATAPIPTITRNGDNSAGFTDGQGVGAISWSIEFDQPVSGVDIGDHHSI